MKRLVATLFILLLASSLVSGETYELPGVTPDQKPYNNIGILGEVMIDLNVTIVNTAPFPKFVIVNPRYDFHVFRLSNDEYMVSYRVGDTSYHYPSRLDRTSLNYYLGFWVMPYETVVVNFRIPYNNSYLLQTSDYQSICGDTNKITNVTYYVINGSLAHGGKIDVSDDISMLSCGVMYPQLVNTPKIISLRSMFPMNDGHVKVLKYEGTVTFRLTNVPNRAGIFNTFFAASVPVIFKEAKMYNFTPNYTMTYREYMEEFVWKYKGLEPPKRTEPEQQLPSVSGMFQLSNTLLTGVTVGAPVVEPPKEAGLYFPVWIIFLGGSMDIKYHVEWSA
ncbi:hypothetical protein CL1_1024 [Thermococcus cleftensis]|uniref:Uncharacterized protein n=1 Tax=Thermococcus cleftensis (strain DSM 27260 / KACC 17922 / CL1) TaxID=163003 RepID=I3ZU43_THECF|nr:hypothetical protein [Thermococcus cleftensis]AFL95227.1 hypothetical protein CL1_1024 [Thermococcus cleftensis]